jgi:hypothetical protein
MTLEEEAQLSNNLQALITDPDAYIRARILPLLAEGILHSNLSISFRNACALAFRGLLEDESEVVAEGLFEQCIRIYESNTDSLALTLFYDGAVQLASTRSSVRAQVAMALLNRFHEERGVEGLLTMDPHERQR